MSQIPFPVEHPMRRWEDRLFQEHVRKLDAYINALQAAQQMRLVWCVVVGCTAWTAACGLMLSWLR